MEPLAPEDLVDDWSDLSTSSLGPGARLGRYELLLPIAYGGMARVWAARLHGQRGFSKLVAIKTILPHLAHTSEFERMFLDEARIAAGVHHPNVTEIYELGEEGHVLYLAMEWVNGESLVHVVRGLHGQGVAPVDPRVAARIAAEACAGLHAAHELKDDLGRPLNVVHRDVSPHNILVSLEGGVKVTDFGVAKALGQSHQATVAGQIKGKVAYMAPEIIGSAAFDRRSDIWALGCILYEATTGTLPFRGGNDPQVMQAVLKGAYAPAPSLVRGFPLELAAIIDCALASDPRRRFATAEQMRVALEEWLVKSGPLVTPSHLGGLVRERLAAHLDKRRDHVRAAMASAQAQETRGAGNVRPAAGSAPPPANAPLLPTPAGQSHSGVVATSPDGFRARAPLPPMVSPTPPPVAVTAPPPVVQTLPIVHPPPPRRTSNARYAMAAAGGIAFAVIVGGIGVAVWLAVRAPSTRIPPSSLVATASAKPAPIVPPPVVPAAKTAAPAASAPVAVSAPSAAPTTVNVNDLPEAKPAWMEQPAAGFRGPPTAPSAKGPALPANPY
jgi:serine/threonine-protein kinase